MEECQLGRATESVTLSVILISECSSGSRASVADTTVGTASETCRSAATSVTATPRSTVVAPGETWSSRLRKAKVSFVLCTGVAQVISIGVPYVIFYVLMSLDIRFCSYLRLALN